MTLVPYRKPYLTSIELCEKLEQQGLIIDDRKLTCDILQRCSYYRFKAYLFPFQNTDKSFYPATNFTDAYQLYQFDSSLRSYVFDVIERIEIGVRSSLDQWLTSQSDNAFWYLDASLFERNSGHTNTVNRVRSMFIDSKELFAEHFQAKYYNEYCPFYRDLPPAWVAIELMTFGNLTNLLKGFTQQSIQQLKLDRYANKKLGVQKFKTLVSWMATLQEVRNHCGHHTRLFNRNIQSPTGIKRILAPNIKLVKIKPKSGKKAEDQLNRLYTALASLQRLHTALGYTEKLGPALNQLFEDHPVAKRFHLSMGFPQDWQKEPLFFA